ncbi:hypothetical protein [Geodermatophilus sabuli]|uniref:hypothetical protein n=1 Tax=Geodermatophilus sabuli TaxID=1564158 RepID=UPI001558554D|nr:hypothetical protein [Geodermatophilus sabuli]MBB3084360.1 hypothetical protein [Geodermatophilus sabuli]
MQAGVDLHLGTPAQPAMEELVRGDTDPALGRWLAVEGFVSLAPHESARAPTPRP